MAWRLFGASEAPWAVELWGSEFSFPQSQFILTTVEQGPPNE